VKNSTFPLFGCFFFNPQKCLEKLFTTREKLQGDARNSHVFHVQANSVVMHCKFDALNTLKQNE